jgi:hypothetical protein
MKRIALSLFAACWFLALAQAQIGPLPGMAVLPPPLSGAAACGTPVVTNIGTNNTTTGATVTLTGVTVPAASLIVVVVSDSSATAPGGSVSDGANTYTAAGGRNPNNITGNGFLNTFFALNASLTSGTITYTKQTSGEVASISAIYASNIATSSALDVAVTATAVGSSTAPTVTSGTPGVSGELLIGGLAISPAVGTGTMTQDAGNGWAFPPNYRIGGAAGIFQGVGGGNQVNAGTGTKSFAPTLSASAPWAVNVLGFKRC